MRLLLDECVPKRLKRELHGHDTKTVQDMDWAGIKNGALLRLADGQFDALLTVDQGIEYQQNLSGLRISVVIMTAPSTTLTTSAHCCRPLKRLWPVCGLGKPCEWEAHLQMEPARPNTKRASAVGDAQALASFRPRFGRANSVRIDGTHLIRRATLAAVVLSVVVLGGCRRHYPPDPAHGVAMFDADADLKPSIVKRLAARFSRGGPG
jgi:hypothetical protein